MVYLGVDLHRKRSHLVALDERGTPLLSRRITNDPDTFRRVFDELQPESLKVAFEATYGWGWFADLLAEVGIPAHMAHPLATKAISSARVKNDAVDARTLAQLLRSNLLPEAWIAPPEIREARRLVRMRASLVRIRSRLRNQVHAILADRGILPPYGDIFGPAGRHWLATLELPPTLSERVAANARLIDAVTSEVATAEREIRARFCRDARLRQLLPIPGIGPAAAATVIVEVGDVRRFREPDALCSWAGLTPSEHSSDEHVRRGHITKQGSRWLRWTMVEAAATAARCDRALGAYAERIARRRGTKIARVALARRILTLCFYALRDDHGCRAYPVPIIPPRSTKARSPLVMASS